MRLYCAVAVCLMCGVLAGCSEQQTADRQDANLDAELVKTVNNIGVENAIIAQHTLYPYHFTANAEELNELGQRDLVVLARHFARHPGVLNIHRGDVPDDLYNKRIAHVLSGLQAAGVEMGRMQISEGMPGGSGMLSEQVVTILERRPEGRITSASSTTGTSSR